MKTIERLLESKDFWQESAEYQKAQLRLSVAIGSGGLVLAGVGLGLAISGHPAEGIVAIGSGGTLAYVGGKETISDFEDYKEINDKVASREGMAKGISIANSSSREY